MSSLERQLSIVDEYLDRIESKFKKPKIHQVDTDLSALSPPPPPPHLSIVEISFPSQITPEKGRDCPRFRTPNGKTEEKFSESKPKSQSVSITVLSKLVNQDQVNVIFKKSFDSESEEDLYSSTEPHSMANFHQNYNSFHENFPSGILSSAKAEYFHGKPRWSSLEESSHSDSMEEDQNPYSLKNLNKRIAECPKISTTTWLEPAPLIPVCRVEISSFDNRKNDLKHRQTNMQEIHTIDSVAVKIAENRPTICDPLLLKRTEEKVSERIFFLSFWNYFSQIKPFFRDAVHRHRVLRGFRVPLKKDSFRLSQLSFPCNLQYL